jgi:hypothetical protein
MSVTTNRPESTAPAEIQLHLTRPNAVISVEGDGWEVSLLSEHLVMVAGL